MVTTVTWQLSCIILDSCCLSGSGDGQVSRAPCLRKPSLETSQWAGQEGAGTDPPTGSAETGVGPPHTNLPFFSKLGLTIDLWDNKTGTVTLPLQHGSVSAKPGRTAVPHSHAASGGGRHCLSTLRTSGFIACFPSGQISSY